MSRHEVRTYAGWALAVALLGCGDTTAGGTQSQLAEAGAHDAAAGTDAYATGVPDERCVAPDGAVTSPRSIADVVALLNALPKPVTLPCLLDALARPFRIHATDSVFSAQPAEGTRSPRIFLFFPGVTLSVVPEGPGAHLLELGESRGDDRTLKAELEFPIEAQLDEASPYVRLSFSDVVTTCGFCHQGEERATDVDSPLAVVSPALRPRSWQHVPLAELRAELARCDDAAEPERCAMLRALFGRGPAPFEHDFPETYATFF